MVAGDTNLPRWKTSYHNYTKEQCNPQIGLHHRVIKKQSLNKVHRALYGSIFMKKKVKILNRKPSFTCLLCSV